MNCVGAAVMDLMKLLDQFRRLEYHYADVVWHDMRANKLKPLLTEKLADMTRDEFKNLLLSNLFMPARIPEQVVNDIITKNDFNNVKIRLLDLFLGTRSIKERIQSVMNLAGIGPYIASQLLSSVKPDEYTVYHQNVVEGIKDLLPHLVDWEILEMNVSTAEQYLNFNEICTSIKRRFGFKSLGEVHEFFWHGHDSKWNFKDDTG
jgi:hypothetical protein